MPGPAKNKSLPSICVVTPSFNQGAFLEATIRSVLDQDYPNLENVKIYGPGTLDGSALTRSSKVPKGTGDKGIALKLCKNVEIRNLNIRKGGDDAIKFGSDLSLGKARPSENITVRNCYLASGCNTLQFGSETIGTFTNIRFENIRILRAGKAGISITSNDGSVIDGLHYKNIRMEKTFAPIFIKLSDVARVPEGSYKRGAIRNVTFENITVSDSYSYFKGREMPSLIWGKPGSPIENISFKNVRITAKGGHPPTEAALDPVENNERFPRHVGALPAYGFYLRHVKNIRFLDCDFAFEKNDGRPAVLIDDGKTVAFENCRLQKGLARDTRIAFRNVYRPR